MGSTLRVCTIVLNWNGWNDTQECLESLVAADLLADTIIVVDNGSTDNSVKQIRIWGEKQFGNIGELNRARQKQVKDLAELPAFFLIQNDSNIGYATGNNRALTWVLSQQYFDFVWIINNDVVVRADSLSKLVECARLSQVSILGSTVVYYGRDDIVQCAGGCRYTPLTTIYKPALSGKPLEIALKYPGEPEIDYIYGASFFVGCNVLEKCGLFNEEYFLFYEEIDFCRRAHRAGFSLKWCKESIVEHKVSRSVGQPETAKKDEVSKANYHENLSTLLFTKNYHPYLLPLAMIFRFLGKCTCHISRGEWYLLRVLLASYRDFILGKNRRDKI